MPNIKRLRIFAGPNGSGKTTLYYYLVNNKAFKDYYFINSDEITEKLKKSLDLSKSISVKFSMEEFLEFLSRSPFQSKLSKPLNQYINIQGFILTLKNKSFSGAAYVSASIAEFLRQKMLSNSNSSFAFETVLSHQSKLDEIHKAKECGYKVYLYIISTADANINKKRVQERKKMGGHYVPLKKIEDRYYRSLTNACKAMFLADRVFFFDNSSDKLSFIAEKKDDELHIANDLDFLPYWFDEYILKNISN